MDDSEQRCLIDAYIDRYKHTHTWGEGMVLREENRNFWAFEELNRIIREDPETGWKLVLQIVDTDQSPEVMSNLAAGPLEDLIRQHGAAFIERIEREAVSNATFKELLGGVWQVSCPEVWARVEAARGGAS